MKTFTIIVAAGSVANPGATTVDVVGTFVKLVSSTGAAGVVKLRAERVGGGGQSSKTLGQDLTLDAGERPKFEETFDHLTFQNTSGAQVTLVAIIGLGDHESSSLTGSISLSNVAGSTTTSPADVSIGATSSLDLASDSTIRERLLQVPSTNTGELCVRDQSGTTSAGARLNPSGGLGWLVWSNYGALRIRNNGASAQSIFQLLNQA